MDLRDFKYNGGYAYIVGLHFCFPPKYACFKRRSRLSRWVWTDDLTEADTFMMKETAQAHMENDMSALVDGNKDVKVLKVELKVGLA